MIVALIAWWSWCSARVRMDSAESTLKQTWSSESGKSRPWSVYGLFLKTQPGHCIFYSYADLHLENGASQLICQSPPLGHLSSWKEKEILNTARRAFILHGDNKERSREASKDMTIFHLVPRHNGRRQKVELALWVRVPLFWQPIRRCLPQGAIVHLQTCSDATISSFKWSLFSLSVIKAIC